MADYALSEATLLGDPPSDEKRAGGEGDLARHAVASSEHPTPALIAATRSQFSTGFLDHPHPHVAGFSGGWP